MTTSDPVGSTEYFDASAASWDDDPAKVARAHDVAARIADLVALDPTTRVLEYGAGTGLVSEALRPHVGPLTLADASPGMREVVEAKVAAGALADARVWDLDLATDPPPHETFDLIVTVMALHHITDLDPVFDGFARLLCDDGRLCIADLDREDGSFHGEGFTGHHGFHRPDLTARLGAHGFGDVRYVDCDPMIRDASPYPVFLAVASPVER